MKSNREMPLYSYYSFLYTFHVTFRYYIIFLLYVYLQTCTTNGGDCVTIVNGYFLEMALCTVIGIVWYLVFKNVLKDLQIKGPSHWMVNVKKPIAKKDKTSYSMAVIWYNYNIYMEENFRSYFIKRDEQLEKIIVKYKYAYIIRVKNIHFTVTFKMNLFYIII